MRDEMGESLGQSAGTDQPGAKGSQKMWSGTLFGAVLSDSSWNILHPTISAGPAPSFATQAGGELEQIQFLLGHASVLTTERYLGCRQNLEKPVNDRFGPLIAFKEVETS
jgi:hypothetical protein